MADEFREALDTEEIGAKRNGFHKAQSCTGSSMSTIQRYTGLQQGDLPGPRKIR